MTRDLPSSVVRAAQAPLLLLLLFVFALPVLAGQGGPPPPTNVAATAGDSKVTLTWVQPYPSLNVNVYRSSTTGGPYTKITPSSLPGATTTFADTGLVNGTPCYYVLKSAVPSYGYEGASTPEVSATPKSAVINRTPDFGFGTVPSHVALTPPGGNTSISVPLLSLNGFVGTVSISATCANSGISLTLNQTSIALDISDNPLHGGSKSADVTANVAATVAPGNYDVAILCVSGNLSHTYTFTVYVGGALNDFGLLPTPSSLNVVQGNSGTVAINIVGVNGTNGLVSLSALGLPAGVTATFSPTSSTSGSVLTFATSSTVVPGTYSITVTGVTGNLTHTRNVSLTVTSSNPTEGSDYLSAFATSASTIRVYWQPVPGAASYKVFRSTVSGQYNLSTPIATVDASANRTARAYYADDANLTTGTEYFYTVMSVRDGVSSTLSEEDSATPNADAIPWNGTPAQILSKAQQIADAQETDPDTGDILPYKLLVMGPDATMYDGDTQTALPPNTVEESTGTFVIQGIRIPMPSSENDDGLFTAGLRSLPLFGNLGLSAHSYRRQGGQGGDLGYAGALRRTWSVLPTAQNDISGVMGTFVVPSDRYPFSGIQMADIGTVVSLYLGIHDTSTTLPPSNRGVEIDAGATYNQLSIFDPSYPNRWSILMRVSDGSSRDRTYDHTGLNHRVNSFKKFIVDTAKYMPLGGKINAAFTINRLNKRCFSSQSFLATGGSSTSFTTFVEIGAVKRLYSFYDARSVGRTQQFKRQVAIDEDKHEAYLSIKYADPSDIVGTAKRYLQQNSRLIGAGWQNGQLLLNGSWQPWTTTFLDPINSKWHHRTVSLNPPNGDPTAESINIDLSVP